MSCSLKGEESHSSVSITTALSTGVGTAYTSDRSTEV
jgi:hypothetical protein